MFAVVNIMRMDHPLQVGASFFRHPFYPLVDDNIVKHDIKEPITEDPQSDTDHVRVVFDLGEIIKDRDRRDAENNGKQVVLFKRMVMHGVVGLMPPPEKTMHNVFVGKPGNAFPEQKGANDNQQTQQHLGCFHVVVKIVPVSA